MLPAWPPPFDDRVPGPGGREAWKEFIDADTPEDAYDSTSARDGAKMKLVFSDEFNVDGRTFNDGDDTKWTALDKAVSTNANLVFYKVRLPVSVLNH